MALGNLVPHIQRSMEGMDGGHFGSHLLPPMAQQLELLAELARRNQAEEAQPAAEERGCGEAAGVAYLSHSPYLCDLRHDAGEATNSEAGQLGSGVVSKWRIKDRMKTGCVALVLCLNIGVDPPDVIKVSPCARLECWIDPFIMQSRKALELIGGSLQAQYERWQPRAKYKLQLDPTVDDVKKLCLQCRKSAKSERVLFHYNGHGVPRPTMNGELWFFNKSYTQYIPLSVHELESWLGNPSIYVLDCPAAGRIVNAFCERPEWGLDGTSTPARRDCILLAACGALEGLAPSAELPADIFTSCLTTPIKIALRWFCPRSLLPLDPELIDNIPGQQTDRKTPLGELNWIFTAITDTIAWNVLPRELFQRLFRQDLLVASLFRNFLLAERIMRTSNCSPKSHPPLPPTHQHPMWHAWDMAAELRLSQLPGLLSDQKLEFQPSTFFTEQLTAFEVWLEHGSERKKPPEQLPIVLQVLLSQSHRFRALVLLGRFLDMGAWAVDLALSVGIFPYVLKLLQTTAADLRQILVFIWTKILALDKSCQVDLVKDGGHQYFIKFLGSPDIHTEQRAMAAFVLSVIVDSHPRGQLACIQAGLVRICLAHVQSAPSIPGGQSEPLLLQWLCLCLGKLWDGAKEAIAEALHENAPVVLLRLLEESQPEVRAAATYALGTLVKVVAEAVPGEGGVSEDEVDDDGEAGEQEIARCLLKVLYDGSPLVRTELAIALARLATSHNRLFRSAAASYMTPPSHAAVFAGFGTSQRPPCFAYSPQLVYAGASSLPATGSVLQHHVPAASDSSLRADSVGYGTGNGGNRCWKRTEEANVFIQCVTAAHALVRDPSPQVASLGRQVLKFLGVEPAQIVKASKVGTNGFVHHHRVPCVPAMPQIGSLHQSTSWIASSPGKLASTWRILTPPPSPPSSRTGYLSGNAGNMRRVASMDFVGAAGTNTWDSTRPPARISGDIGSQMLSPIPKSLSVAAGLADAAGMLSFRPSSADPEILSVSTSTHLPKSSLYSWSCGHFSRPLLEPFHDDVDEVNARRERREHLALNGIAKCQQSSMSKVSDQISSWDTVSEMGTRAVLLHPFNPIVCIADEKETIRIWNYEEAVVVNTFDNHNAPEKGVSKLCLLNELDDSLLLVASSDGSVRIWKDYTQKSKIRQATAWQTVQGHRPGVKSINAVVAWQQITGRLYASGELSSIMVWDVDREQLIFSIPHKSDGCISAMSASEIHGAQLIAGCGDGSVRVFDVRTRDMLSCVMKAHTQKVVGLDFQPGLDPTKMISASAAGDLKFLDLRNSSGPYSEVEAHKGHLTCMAIHRHAPLVATGSGKQFIKTFSMTGEQLSMVRYHSSFLGQRIGPVSSLHFHPYDILLAAGASDSIVSVYAGESMESI